jgi:hypothetical protein
MKLWAGAEAAYSFNVELDSPDEFSQPSMSNILLNGGNKDRDVDFRSSSWTPSTPKILRSDLIFSIAGLQINVNFRIPLFLQWKLNTGGGGTAYAGSYYKARVTQGIVYTNPSHSDECSMPGCISSCYGWCTVNEKVVKQGGSGPVWTFTKAVDLTVHLTPIFVIDVWSGYVLGFFQASALSLPFSFPPSPFSLTHSLLPSLPPSLPPSLSLSSSLLFSPSSRLLLLHPLPHPSFFSSSPEFPLLHTSKILLPFPKFLSFPLIMAMTPHSESTGRSRQVNSMATVTGSAPAAGCISLSVDVDASAYVWGRLDIYISFLGFKAVSLVKAQSTVITLFNSIGRVNLISIPCVAVTDAATSNLPFAVERAVDPKQTAVLSMKGTKGVRLATLTIRRSGDPNYGNSLPSASSFSTSSTKVRAEAQGQPDRPTAQRPGKSVSTTVKLTPSGTQFLAGAQAVFRVLNAGSRRSGTDMEYCQTQLRAVSQTDEASPWKQLATPALDCSRSLACRDSC